MLSRFVSTVFLVLIFQVYHVVTSEVLNYKLSQMYADMFSELEACYLRETEGFLSILQGYSELSKALLTYQQAITKAQGTSCDTSSSATNIQSYKNALDRSRKECQNLPTCATDLGQNTHWIVQSAKEIDEEFSKDANACSDAACKLKAYDDLQSNLFDLYEDFMPAMHLGAAVNLAETLCSAEILSCFNNKNSNNIQQIQAEISKLKACTANK